jgi:transmembrane sensor
MNQVEEKAADWLVRSDRGLDPAEQKELATWLHADPRHAEVYAELEDTWCRIDALRETTPLASRVPPSCVSRRPLWFSATIAAAAVIVFAWFNAARLAPPALPPYTATASTAVGELRTLPLPDGSIMQLNTATTVTVHFTAGERRVQLIQGEAHFQVAKNPARPFVVSAGAVAVKAIGTAFDVRLQTETVTVLVTEGKVRVDDSVKGESMLPVAAVDPEAPLLVAGQRAVIPTASGRPSILAVVSSLGRGEMSEALAWQSRRLEFVATPLSTIVAEFNRYNLHKLVLTDPQLAERRFGGTFAANDSEELVRLLEVDFGVLVERGENETRLRLAP